MANQVQARQGERWDTLCWRIYDRATQSDVMTLRDANRQLVIDSAPFTFEGGELVNVPFIDVVQDDADVGVAPWQR